MKKRQDQTSAKVAPNSKRIRKQATDDLLASAENQPAELPAHQIDLEIQNEELLQARDLLEESRDRYVDFYDFSPVGYLTLSHKSLITEINLTGAAMLGEARDKLRRRRFADFLAVEDNDFWIRHFMVARQQEGKLTCELSIVRGDGSRLDVQIDSLRLVRDGQEPVVRLALTDITARKLAEAALRASENRQRQLEQQKIIQTSLDGFLVARAADARILEVNEAFCNTVGYSRAELLTMCIFDLEVEESPEETAVHIKKVMELGYDRFETRHRHKQGHLVDLEASVSYSSSDGGVNFVFTRDITERKLAEQQLKQALEFSEGIISAIPDVLFEMDRNGTYLNVWTQNLELLAAQKQALLGKNVHEVFSPEAAAAAMDAIREADEKGTSVGRDICIDLPQGRFWFSHSLSKKPGNPSSAATFMVLSRDITERKQSEALLVQRESEFRTFAENMPDNIIRYNREGVTIYVNPALERTLGDRAAAMIGTTPREYHPDGSYEDYAQLLDAVLASGEARELEKTLSGPGGETSIHQIRMVSEFGENGEVVAC